MANGANRLFDVIKQTGESTNGISSQVVSLTIKSVNPLILMRDDRLEIPAEFCILHKSLNIDTFRINDIVTAIVLNNGQQYFILYNNTAEEQGANYNDLSNKPKINNVTLTGNKTASDLDLDNYTNLDNKPKINGVELNGNKTSNDLGLLNKVINVVVANTDLDDYKEDGEFYFGVDYTPTNIPTGVNGWLKVITGIQQNDNVVKQIWYRHGTPNSNDYETYVRTFSSSAWSSWKMFGMQSSIDSLNNNKVNKSGDTMTGDLNMQNNSVKFGSTGNLLFKEDGYGDKFRIVPNFSGSGSSNKLVIQSTIGDAGTDPQNWKDLVYIHADSGEINLLDLITANKISLNSVAFPNNAYSPKYFQMTWGTTMTVATEVGGHGLIFTSNQALYIFWIAGGNHDQLSVNTVWGNSNHCNITMPDNAHIRVTTRNGDNMTCTILFFKNP